MSEQIRDGVEPGKTVAVLVIRTGANHGTFQVWTQPNPRAAIAKAEGRS